MNNEELKIKLKKVYHTLKKNIYWKYLGIDFATQNNKLLCEHLVFQHKTPLRRKLKKVDDWLNQNKIRNLSIAIRRINGLVIEPGQIFSYWRQIGNPTNEKGYLNGMILNNGEITSGIGGGLCQLSNIIYWVVLHSHLRVIERWRHDFDVFPDSNRTQPFGTGATCCYPNIDLQIINPTINTYKLNLEMDDLYLYCSLYASDIIESKFEIIERSHCIKQEIWGRYTRNNTIIRKEVDLNSPEKVVEEVISHNSAIMMYEPLIEVARKS